MAKVARDLTEIIGRTPLVRLNVISDETGVEVLGKLEACNPGGSIKDRAAYYMVKEREDRESRKIYLITAVVGVVVAVGGAVYLFTQL